MVAEVAFLSLFEAREVGSQDVLLKEPSWSKQALGRSKSTVWFEMK